MASTSLSLSLSTQFIGSTFSAAVAPICIIFPRQQQPSRISASYAITERTSTAHIASQTTTLYQVLGIPMGATCQDIKAAYRRLARVLHPDVVASNSANQDTSAAADEFMRVRKAYTTLSDPEKRADYDRTLFRRTKPSYVLSASTSYSSGYTCRTWETDQCW